MSESKTLARPYAKAIFNHALEVNKLEEWSIVLKHLVSIINNHQVTQFILNPAATSNQHYELINSTIGSLINSTDIQSLDNFIKLLSENKRLLLLPEIKILFEALRAQQEKTLIVEVISYSPLSEKQQENLINSLNKRLQRQISLNVSIDQTLLGGAIINAGGLVIDGSVRGKLDKLKIALAA